MAFHIIFTRAPLNFTWEQARVCSDVATPLTVNVISIARLYDVYDYTILYISAVILGHDGPLYIVHSCGSTAH